MGVRQVAQMAIRGMQETVIKLVARDFPELKSLAQKKIAAIYSWEHLEQLILDLHRLRMQEEVEVEQFLLSLDKYQLKGNIRGIGRRRATRYDPADSFCHWLVVEAFTEGYSEALQQRIQVGTLEIPQAIQWSVESRFLVYNGGLVDDTANNSAVAGNCNRTGGKRLS
jgi:hypothetical protein